MNKIVTILVAALCMMASAIFAQTSLTISPTTVTGNTGETVTVSMVANGFTDLVSMQYGIKWDPAVIEYSTVGDFNLPDLTAGNFNPDAANGFLAFSWFDNTTQGVSVVDGSTIYTISFTVLGDANSGSTVTFESRPGLAIEIASSSAGEITNAVTLTNSQFGDPNGNGGGPPPPPAVTPITTTISGASGDMGATVCLDVTASNFTDITEMQYSLNWDASSLQYNEVTSLNLPGLTQGSFGTTNTASGQLSVDWSDTQGQSITGSQRIYQVCFDLIGAEGTSSAVSITGTPTPISINTLTSTESIGLTASNGTVSINNGTPPPPPPPATGTNLVNISTVEAQAGSTVCVPVTVSDFNSIASLQFSLSWDPSVLQYSDVQNLNLPDLNAGTFNATDAASGKLAMAWFDNTAQGVTLANGTTIFEMCFTVLGASGTSSGINFTNDPTPREAATPDATITFTETAGAVNVDGGSVTPPPTGGTALVNLASMNTPVGSTVCMPITVNDFDGIASLQFSLSWDPAVLQFDEVRNFNLPDLNAGSFNTTQTANGQTAVAWFDNTAQGVTLADGSTLFEICFTVLGSDGTSSNITFTDVPTPREAATPSNTIAFTETNGSITVGTGTPPPPPPPNPGGDQLVNLATVTAAAGSTVCVPMTVTDFNSIASLQFSLSWDPAVLQFDEVRNFNLPDLNAGSFNTTQTANGQTAVAWFDNAAQGVTLQDGSIIFEICFTVLGTTGTSSAITFTDVPTPREAATPTNTIDFTETNGLVTVGTDPDPPSGDGIINIADIDGSAGSNICVPITALDFDAIAAMQFSLSWDPTVLEFTGTQGFGLPDLTAGGFNIDGAANGQLAVAWFDNAAQGITLADGTTIFEVCFNVIGSVGSSTTIGFTDTPTARELATSTGTIPFTSSEGTITVVPGNTTGGESIINIDNVNSPSGSSVCIPVSVKDFNDIASMQFSLGWDPSVLEFTGVEDFGLTDLNAGSFNVDNASSGQLAVAWVDNAAQGITLADGTVIFEVCFNVIGAGGTSTSISFTDVPTSREIATATGTIPFTSTNGTFSVDMDPPPSDLDQLVNIAPDTIRPGAAFCVPITVHDFNGIASMQFSLNWDQTVLEFTGVQSFGISDLTAAGFNTDNAGIGQLSMAWFDGAAQGVTLANGSTLFEACFNAIGSDGTQTTISFSDTPTPREAATATQTVPFTQTDGIISIRQGDNPPVCPAAISVLSTPRNVSCNGLRDGAISLQVSGGDGTYNYTWSDPSIGNTPNPTGLAAGVYNVTITSCGGNEVKSDIPAASLTITEPPAIITVVTPQAATCEGGSDGRINISISGGTLPYTYNWSDPNLAPSNRPVNAAPGTYNLTITDGTGCTNITNGIVITTPASISATATTIAASCTGIADGSISITPSVGSVGDYSYQWSNTNFGNTANPSNVQAGNYMVTISGGNLCPTVIPVTVPATVVVSGVVQIIEDACGDGKGGAQITVSGGQTPYSYEWTGPITIDSTNNSIENIPSGNYTVRVTDANGCFFEENILVGGPTAILSSTATIVDVDCVGDNSGSIQLTTAGGFSPYTYSWSNGATADSLTNLTPGDYSVTITDSKVCTYTETYTVGTTSNLLVSVEITKSAPNAEATATVSGGVTPYTYEWCNGQEGPDATNLEEGNCSLTVMDALGCAVVQNIEIIVDNPVASIIVDSDISCGGQTDGVLRAEVAGGKAPFSFAWSNGATTEVLTNVGLGTYAVTITDANGNTGMVSSDFIGPAPIVIAGNITDACEDGGSIGISITGGNTPYKSIRWSNDIMDALTIERVQAGDYGVIVTDQKDCTAEADFSLRSDPTCITCYEGIKVMTPNDDGRNDAFRINCVNTAKSNHVEVYNRWGQLIFEADNYTCELGTEADCWRGRTRGDRLVDKGGYFWVLEFDDTNGRRRIKEHLTILDDN